MREWLNGFEYRTSINWVNFAIGMGATLAIVICTVSYRSMKSAVANPVDVLRSE
jgi:putative ABC transport system permease protein